MSWVDQLPGVECTDFQARRDDVAELNALAEEIEQQAEELKRRAAVIKGQAYFRACRIEGDAKEKWSNKLVYELKNRFSTVS